MATKQHKLLKDGDSHVLGYTTEAEPSGKALGIAWVDPANGRPSISDGADMNALAFLSEISAPASTSAAAPESERPGTSGELILDLSTGDWYEYMGAGAPTPWQLQFDFSDFASGAPAGTGTTVTDKTDSYAIQLADLGTNIGASVLTMTAATSKTFSLPSVGAGDIGKSITLVKLGAGTMVIDAADADTIAGSAAGGNIYFDVAGETYASATLLLVSATSWIIVSGHGTIKTDLA